MAHKMGHENQKLNFNLEASRAGSKNNCGQGNFWRNNTKRHGTYICDLHTLLGDLLEMPEFQPLKSYYRVDLKALSAAAKVDKANWAMKRKQVADA